MKYVTPALLRKAANKYLWDGKSHRRVGAVQSCVAVVRALHDSGQQDDDGYVFKQFVELFNKMGVNFGDPFWIYPDLAHHSWLSTTRPRTKTKERQAARFMWLHFLANVLEDDAL